MSTKSKVLFQGISLAVSTFVLMSALDVGGQQLASLNIQLPYTANTLVMLGMGLVLALSIPMLKAGMKGSAKYAMAFGTLPSFVLGMMLFAVV